MMEELRENTLIKLLITIVVFLLISSLLLWFIGLKWGSLLVNYLLLFAGLFFFILFVLMSLSILTLVLFFRNKRLPGFLKPVLKLTLSKILPFVFAAGSILRISSARLQKAFVRISNHVVQNQGIKLKPEELFVLAPHCLQLATCPHKVTHDVNNCRRCGKCQINDLIRICSERGVELKIVTGGTLARKMVKETKPKAILAIACERDLSSGIKDTYPLPVYGIFNIRPYGPCFNTRVDLEKVERVLDAFLEG